MGVISEKRTGLIFAFALTQPGMVIEPQGLRARRGTRSGLKGGAREGRAKGEKRGKGAALPSRLDIYGFLFGGRIDKASAVKKKQRGERLGASRNTRFENRRAF